MSPKQSKEFERDTLIVSLDRACLDLRVDLKNPTIDELYSVETIRDALSRWLEKHEKRKAA